MSQFLEAICSFSNAYVCVTYSPLKLLLQARNLCAEGRHWDSCKCYAHGNILLCLLQYRVSRNTFICTEKYTVYSIILGSDLKMMLTGLFILYRIKAGFSLFFLSWRILFSVLHFAVVHMLSSKYLSPHSLVSSTDIAVACHSHVRHIIPFILLFRFLFSTLLDPQLNYIQYLYQPPGLLILISGLCTVRWPDF